ncbi:MAG: GAF domain-containing protein, partial [Chloroflexota bacterium]
GGGLSREVVRVQRPIVTEDHERECRKYGFPPVVEGLYAWMGVPLNAGAETIGSISLASRDPAVFYSEDQVRMLQAIADQAAGAIVKTRLLDETQRRARQLSLLNDIGRSLTSTLDLNSLLNQILDHAIDIIGCEAGTLFLLDEDTGELIFEVVAGPVVDELVGQRLAPGTGHVGKAVITRQPAIVNDVHSTEEWASKPDEKTGFQTRNLLLVPMLVQDRVIGVIEVINRRDGTPFSLDDQDLLIAYTSQAAIALENARLYTLTDQQLAARVDELSAMQRIDRELNASLDIQRAMRITLDWAMRQSGADAGLIGSVEENGVQIMADWGYDGELEDYREGILPLDKVPALRSAVGEVDTQIFKRSQMLDENHHSGILEGMRSQMIYPIRREEQVIGVMLLESRQDDAWAPHMQDFLSRLSDHAAIAIANAQLFAQVRAADIAKSDFISFVAHELKTPMTSIRGYADLLLGGAMGELNEGQANFLQTVLSNVSRMAALVSDLSDISRIEAGRLRLEFESVDVAGMVNEVVRAQAHSLDAKNQTLELQIPEDLAPVWGDRIRLIQVLANLVSNANKYSPEGGVVLIWAEQVENRWDPEGAAEVVRIGVKDNGIG